MIEYIRSRMRLKAAWRRILLGDGGELNESAKVVIADLRKFCCVDRTTAVAGERADLEMAALEGRRQVWLHVMARLKPDAQLQKLLETAEGE